MIDEANSVPTSLCMISVTPNVQNNVMRHFAMDLLSAVIKGKANPYLVVASVTVRMYLYLFEEIRGPITSVCNLSKTLFVGRIPWNNPYGFFGMYFLF